MGAEDTTAAREQSRFFGKYRGFVADNQDPEHRARLRLTVPSVLGAQTTGWALPCLPFGGLTNQGLLLVPEVDAQVWVEFEEGNTDQPIWVGVFWQQSGDLPEEGDLDEPTTRVLRTPSGHVLQFDDAAGEEQFRLAHPAGAEMTVDAAGTFNLTDAAGATVTLDAEAGSVTVEDSNGNTLTMDASGTVIEDANGNKVEMTAAGITVKGTQIVIDGSQVAVGGQGGEPLVKASFLALFATHVHTTTAPGAPTSPPIPQGETAKMTSATTAK